jgi:hypothetical protein
MAPLGRAEEELPPLPKGPLMLTSVTPEQLNPDYWIKRIPNAETPIKTPAELSEFNEEIEDAIQERKNVFKLDASRRGAEVSEALESTYNTVSNRLLFGVDDQRIPKEFFEQKVKPVMAWETVPSRVKLKWGVAVRPASVRAVPTDVKMLEELGDIEFDQLQFTQIKTWTPVGILHTSPDGQWYYLQAPYSRGWVHAKDIALFPSRGEMKEYVKSPDFFVVTGESVRIYSDPELTASVGRASMGTVLPRAKLTPRTVWMPFRKSDGTVSLEKAYLDPQADVSAKFPAFSQANIIRQAFKLLGARYGWGGQYNGRDCSGFTHDVFLSLGAEIPRDSKYQSIIGTQISAFTPYKDAQAKIQALRSSAPGMTLIKMPAHMMLYLGEVNGNFYVIHSTWAERYDMKSDAKNRINQVVVSDLTLNGKSYLGSLFDRIVGINEMN